MCVCVCVCVSMSMSLSVCVCRSVCVQATERAQLHRAAVKHLADALQVRTRPVPMASWGRQCIVHALRAGLGQVAVATRGPRGAGPGDRGIGGLVGGLVGWLVGWLIGWLIGWLVGFYYRPTFVLQLPRR